MQEKDKEKQKQSAKAFDRLIKNSVTQTDVYWIIVFALKVAGNNNLFLYIFLNI